MGKQKVIAVDLDESLCTGSKPYSHLGIEKYRYCVPIQENIEKINKLYDQGCRIVVYTSRGMGTLGGDLGVIYNTLYEPTKADLGAFCVSPAAVACGAEPIPASLEKSPLAIP